ncbi:MAG: hypothetical protein E7454_06910 [Ruminococcaceae bacterium]|nr:hypothetical protein [Oscillospiraceae bacterium]
MEITWHHGKKKPEYKWIIVAVSFLMVFVCLALCGSNKSRYLKAIADTLKLEHGALSISDTFRFLSLPMETIGVILLIVTVMYQFIIISAHKLRKNIEAEV